jgi:luciferase-like monooxygenase
MITKFDSLFAGHTDLDNVGYGGTPINERRYSNAHLVTALSKAENMARLMDGLGYNCFWMAEHHFQREGTECIPNNLMMAVHLAHRTKSIKIGCGFNIAPMWHPLRLAEDYAVADFLTGGRVVFGLGRGYHTREVETFGAPLRDQEANRELYEEQTDIIFKAFNQEAFSHKGKYYTLPPEIPYRGYTLKDLTLVPRPVNLPVECWQPIQGGRWSSWPSTASRAWWAAAPPRAAPCTRWCSTGRLHTPSSASASNSASGFASASTSSWPTAARRASRRPPSTTRRT